MAGNGSNMGGIPALSFLSGLGGGLIQAKQYANQLAQQKAQNAIEEEKAQYGYLGNVNRGSTAAGIRGNDSIIAGSNKSITSLYQDAINKGATPDQANAYAVQQYSLQQSAPQNAPPVTQLPGQMPSAPVQVNPGGGVGSQVQPQSPVVNPGMNGPVNQNMTGGNVPVQQPPNMTATLPLVGAQIANLGSKTNLNNTNSTYIAGPKTADTSASAAYTAGSKTLNTNADTGLKNQQATGQGLTNQTIIPKANSQIRLQGAEGSALTSNASSNNLKANAAVTTAAAELSRARSYANLTSAQVANYANVFGLDKQKFASAIQNRPELIKSTTRLIAQATADKAKYNAAPAWSATNPNGMTSAAKAAGLKAANDALYNYTQRLNGIVNSAGNPPSSTRNQQQPTPRAAPTSGAGMTTIGPGLTADASGNIYKNGQPTGHRLK